MGEPTLESDTGSGETDTRADGLQDINKTFTTGPQWRATDAIMARSHVVPPPAAAGKKKLDPLGPTFALRELLGTEYATAGMGHCVLAILARHLEEHAPKMGKITRQETVKTFRHATNGYAVGHFAHACKRLDFDFWKVTEDEDIYAVMLEVERMTERGFSIASVSHIIKSWMVCAATFTLWKRALHNPDVGLKALVDYYCQISLKATGGDAFDFAAFFSQWAKYCADVLSDLEKKGFFSPGAAYNQKYLATLRGMAHMALRLVLIGRNIDIWEIRTYEWQSPTPPRYPLGVLWLFMRRKASKRWKWEPVVPTSKPQPFCAVRLFRIYLWKLHSSPAWKRAPKEDEWKQPASVWRSSLEVPTPGYPNPHHPVAVTTLASECKRLLHKCGVPKDFTAKSTRKSVATFLLEVGEPVDVVQNRGNWTSMLVFQQHYSRVANSKLFGDILQSARTKNSKTIDEEDLNHEVNQAEEVFVDTRDRDDIEDYALSVSGTNDEAITHHWLTKEYLNLSNNEGVSTTNAMIRRPPLPADPDKDIVENSNLKAVSKTKRKQAERRAKARSLMERLKKKKEEELPPGTPLRGRSAPVTSKKRERQGSEEDICKLKLGKYTSTRTTSHSGLRSNTSPTPERRRGLGDRA
ncbi:MAG: hypothetical protein NPIRA02_42570 [Nitrospirales bacterium]|nr:MAG: hypothetical protein NPIRA02_42570 [Nitrospirales bacterium]